MNTTFPLSLAMAGLDGSEAPRDQLARLSSAGFQYVQLNAAAPGFRPRELGASSRRDLAASLSRSELRLSGIDLWIAREDFEHQSKVDRAMSAAVGAVELLRDLTALRAVAPGAAVCMLIDDDMSEAASLAACAQSAGVQIADHAANPNQRCAVGVDPGLLLTAGMDPIKAVFDRQDRLVAARLSDVNFVGRCEVGKGRLDVLGYAVALSTVGFAQPIVIDARGLSDPMESAQRARDLLRSITALPGA